MLVIALLAVTRRLVPLQTSLSGCLLWCFRRNRVKKSRSPHSGRSCRRIPPSRVSISVTVCLSNFNQRPTSAYRANHSAEPSKHGCFAQYKWRQFSLGLGTGLEVLGISLAKTRAIYFSLSLHDLLDNHYVTARTGNLDSC